MKVAPETTGIFRLWAFLMKVAPETKSGIFGLWAFLMKVAPETKSGIFRLWAFLMKVAPETTGIFGLWAFLMKVAPETKFDIYVFIHLDHSNVLLQPILATPLRPFSLFSPNYLGLQSFNFEHTCYSRSVSCALVYISTFSYIYQCTSLL